MPRARQRPPHPLAVSPAPTGTTRPPAPAAPAARPGAGSRRQNPAFTSVQDQNRLGLGFGCIFGKVMLHRDSSYVNSSRGVCGRRVGSGGSGSPEHVSPGLAAPVHPRPPGCGTAHTNVIRHRLPGRQASVPGTAASCVRAQGDRSRSRKLADHSARLWLALF